MQDQIEAIAADQHLLLVLDGLDKALQGQTDAAIIPAKLPKNIRVLLSARWEVGTAIRLDGYGGLGGIARFVSKPWSLRGYLRTPSPTY